MDHNNRFKDLKDYFNEEKSEGSLVGSGKPVQQVVGTASGRDQAAVGLDEESVGLTGLSKEGQKRTSMIIKIKCLLGLHEYEERHECNYSED